MTPGRLILAVPSNDTPPIVLAVSNAVAVSALPVKSPVTSPITPPVAVVVPTTLIFCKNVALVLVLILSVDATPVKLEPSPVNVPPSKFPLNVVAVIKPVAYALPSGLSVIPLPTNTFPPTVDVPDTLMFWRNVAFVLVLILSVDATPVKFDPSPVNVPPLNVAAVITPTT